MRVAQDATTALADAARIHRKRLLALIARRAKYRFAENFHAAVLLLRIYRSTGARSRSPQEPLLPRISGPFRSIWSELTDEPGDRAAEVDRQHVAGAEPEPG